MDGAELRAWRKERGLTQGQLAGILEVSQSMLSQIESGRRPIPDQPRELYPGQREQDGEAVMEPSMEEEIRQVLAGTDEELQRELRAAAQREDEPELTDEERRRLFERHSGKVADSRPKVPIGDGSGPKKPKPKPRKPGKVKVRWMTGRGPDYD